MFLSLLGHERNIDKWPKDYQIYYSKLLRPDTGLKNQCFGK